MQKLFILKSEVRFDLVAALLMETPLLLTDVVSCTFPSRPEPKSANWEIDNVKMLNYVYLPDIEIRYLCLLNPSFLDGHSFDAYWADLSNVALFETWSNFSIEPFGDYRTNLRAMHAFQVGAALADTSQAHLRLLVDALLHVISEKDNISAEGIADTLRDIALPEIEAELRAAYDDAESLTVRSHLRKAIDRCMNRLEF